MKKDAAPERRVKLLDDVVEYLLSNGLAGLSLRPLAAGINTSPRMLLYFFGSKEKLISEAMAEIRLRQRADFARAIAGHGGREERLLRAWNAWSSPKTARFWKFCFEVYGAALQKPGQFAEFLERFINEWLTPFEQALRAAEVPPARARHLATLSLAAMRGLQFDLLATGARPRIGAAFRELLGLLAVAIREARDAPAGAKAASPSMSRGRETERAPAMAEVRAPRPRPRRRGRNRIDQ